MYKLVIWGKNMWGTGMREELEEQHTEAARQSWKMICEVGKRDWHWAKDVTDRRRGGEEAEEKYEQGEEEINQKGEGERWETGRSRSEKGGREQEGHRQQTRSWTKAYFCTIRFAAICSLLLQPSPLLCLSEIIPHDLLKNLAALQACLRSD